MTDKQKEKLILHIHLNKPHKFTGENIRFLNPGDTIMFTNCVNYSQNSEYEINSVPNWKIWFSQLSEFFFTDEIDLHKMYTPIIEFKDGRVCSIQKDFDSCSFYNAVKGKKFKVDILADAKYIFNKESTLWNTKRLITYLDAYNYVKQCIANERIDDLGDLIKTANAYYLTEV